MLYNGGEDKMLAKNAEKRGQFKFVRLEYMFPQDSLAAAEYVFRRGDESRGRGRMSGHRSDFCGRNAIC